MRSRPGALRCRVERNEQPLAVWPRDDGEPSWFGIEEIFVDGSFVENKLHPNDIDGYFVCHEWPRIAAEFKQKLNLRNPHKIWTWEVRWPYRGQDKPQLPMWHVYRVELFPHFGQGTGIVDEHGHELEFPAAFRKRRGDFARKGIVRLRKRSLLVFDGNGLSTNVAPNFDCALRERTASFADCVRRPSHDVGEVAIQYEVTVGEISLFDLPS
jgi:hypothetical protein